MQGPLHQRGYQPRLSGHETFPLRYGWLKKVHDRVSEIEPQGENSKAVCWGDDAIARFGVGKNMVASMRHWANAVGIIEEPPGTGRVRRTAFGRVLCSRRGLDPHLEHPASLWLIHWKLATAWEKKTTWCWAFNHYPIIIFERTQLVDGLARFAQDQGWARAAHTTIRSDISCFIRTYVPQPTSSKAGCDDTLESPLIELCLIKHLPKRNAFRFARGPKTTLGNGVFACALLEFWATFADASTLSFEAIAHGLGSPGRVFMLDENDVIDRLSNVEDVTDGALRWSETAGLKQVVRHPDLVLNWDNAIRFAKSDYDDCCDI